MATITNQKNSNCQERHDEARSNPMKPPDNSMTAPSVTNGHCCTPSPQAPAQTVFAHLNAKLQQEHSDTIPDPQQQALEQLGHLIRQWRLRNGYTRQALADQVGFDLNQLLCLENCIGIPEDITAAQLHTLSTFLTDDAVDTHLRKSIQHYLASYKA